MHNGTCKCMVALASVQLCMRLLCTLCQKQSVYQTVKVTVECFAIAAPSAIDSSCKSGLDCAAC